MQAAHTQKDGGNNATQQCDAAMARKVKMENISQKLLSKLDAQAAVVACLTGCIATGSCT